jgi:hypothetical protein
MELVTCLIPTAKKIARHDFTGADQLIICAYSSRLIHLANIMVNTITGQSSDGKGDILPDTLKQYLLRVSSTMEISNSWHK